MKVLYILSGTEAKGGATKSFLAMADSVAKAGNDVAVVVPDEGGVVPELRQRGWTVLVVRYMFATLPYLSWSPRDLLRFIPRLCMALHFNLKARKVVNSFARRWGPDIIHENTSVTDLGYHAAREIGVPNVIHIREYGWSDFRRIIPGLKKRLTSSGSYPVAITSRLALFRGKGMDSNSIRVIYNGVLSETPLPYTPDKKPFFLYAGRITEEKGVRDLIESYKTYALKEIKTGRTPFKLKLAGAMDSGEFADQLKYAIENAALENYVDWLGEIEDVGDHYAVAAATVIPSRAEGFGRVMPEAMAAGSLCVVRNSAGLAEQLENGRQLKNIEIAYGYDTVDQLAEILESISLKYSKQGAYEEGGMFFRMIMESRDVVASMYSYENNARKILKLYSDIVGSN